MSSNTFQDKITLKGVRTHNLKGIDIDIPKNKIITVTGVSGSGKSSLAFHTLYKEGQFRYIESLSAYLRQFFNLGARPDLDYSFGLSPAIAIEQNKRLGNSRSTVGTLTEIDDYLRLLFSKLGTVHCHVCGDPLRPKTTDQIVSDIFTRFEKEKIYLLQDFGLFSDKKSLQKFIRRNRKQVDNGGGVTRLLVSGKDAIDEEPKECFYLEEPLYEDFTFPAQVYGVFDRITVDRSSERRLKEDIIKMLSRADKFGIKPLNAKQTKKKISSTTEGDSDEIVLSKEVTFAGDRTKKLIDHAHTDDGCIHTTRAIIKNKKGKILALYDTRFNNYQLPGGKVDAGETIEEGLKRELLEETGVTVKKIHYLGGVKLFFSLGAYVEHMYEVVVDGQIAVKEPKKFSHIGEGTLKNIAKSNVKIVFPDIEVSGLEQVCEGGYYAIWAGLSGLSEKLLALGEYSLSLPQRSTIDPMTNYIQYVDLKEKTLHIIPEENRKKSKHKAYVFRCSGEKLLEGYDLVFGALDIESIQQQKDSSLIRYTDKYYCPNDNIKYPEMSPAHFSANRQEGACEKCHGLGEILQVDFDKVIDPQSKYINAVLPRRDSKLGQAILRKLSYSYQIDDDTLRADLPDRFVEVVHNGDGETYKLNLGGGKYISTKYKGIEDVLISQYQQGVLTVDFQAMLDMRSCPTCDGAKLKRSSLSVKIEVEHETTVRKLNIFDFQSMGIHDLLQAVILFHNQTGSHKTLAERILRPLIDRAEIIDHLGLGYLSTSRQVDTVSGGEIQRLRLAKQLGNKLTGIMYVLDEPTIGLDQKEIKKVIESIRGLQQLGNTIVVVEHNEEFIKASDRVIEIGPGAGDFGGNVVFNGPYETFLESDTLTAQYVRGERTVSATFDHRPSGAEVRIKNASKHNLKNIDVSFNLGSFTIITGPSGAGKTTLMYHTLFTFLQDKQKRIQSQIRVAMLKQGLSRKEIIQAPIMQREKYELLEQQAIQGFYEHIGVDRIMGWEEIDNVLYVNQSSIGKTPRSCPSTFVGVFDDIRKLFAGVTESKMLGFTAGHFSFNSSKGACPECKGYGYKKIELQFLPDTYVPCELCKGRRYKPEILDIKWNGHTISDILSMYVKDALILFKDMTRVHRKLDLMHRIGLGYLKMGQPAHMLSGGESQRLKLVKHLLKTYRGHTVYFLDEPTVGLHPSDIERLLSVLKEFLDRGDTILMIEHEQNLLKFADKVIRLDNGGLKKG